MKKPVRIAAIAIAVIVVAAVLGCGVEQAEDSPESAIQIHGNLKDRDGQPATGEVVYFAAVKDGAVATSFILKDGTTVGLSNPHATTDEDGNFTILVDLEEVQSGKEFTIGRLDCARCFTFPRRRLMREGLALTFRITPDSFEKGSEPKRIDLGEITLK